MSQFGLARKAGHIFVPALQLLASCLQLSSMRRTFSTSCSEGQRRNIDGRFDERAIWEALLKQSEANLKQSEALLKQSEANKAISDAILAHTQRMIRAESAAAMEPDRLDSWYCADGDAHDVASIAGQIVEANLVQAKANQATAGIGSKRVNPVTMPSPCKTLPSVGTPLPGDNLPDIAVSAGEGPCFCLTPNAQTKVPTVYRDTGDSIGAVNCTVAYDIFSSVDEDDDLTDHDAFGGRPSMPTPKLSGDSCPGVVKRSCCHRFAALGSCSSSLAVGPSLKVIIDAWKSCTISKSCIEHSPNKGVGKSVASVSPEAPVRDLMGEQGEVISRVARTGKSCATGDLEGDNVPQSSPTPSLPTQLPPTLQIVNMFTQLPPNMQPDHGILAVGDSAEVPSRNLGAHAAPPWQDKQAITLASVLAPEVGNYALHCLTGLGRPPEQDGHGTLKQLPPNMQPGLGVHAIGDPAEVPSRNPGVHAAPPWQDKQDSTPAIALAPEDGNCAEPPERTSLDAEGDINKLVEFLSVLEEAAEEPAEGRVHQLIEFLDVFQAMPKDEHAEGSINKLVVNNAVQLRLVTFYQAARAYFRWRKSSCRQDDLR